MAQTTSSGRGRAVGDYLVGRQIGSGSFSVVWHARHRVHGTEVAIKEIVTGRLNKKLQDSLMSEIFILKRINHPNIIRLHDIIEKPGKIHIVLEYCKGGDLSMYIQRHGRVAEATAKHFMQQLAAGLQVLRENNLIHRDLKPQNLLLSTSNNNSVLKIADFGFARSLQPRGLAETLCGSPLYMAPEIMQLQKYDAKADLWSVGAILFQLVTAKTPYSGSNQMQLLQNITKSTGLHFPPDTQDLSSNCKDLCEKLLRRNPVERLTFEEFFNHQFVSERQTDELLRNRRPSRVYELSSPECDAVKNALESSSEDYLPFPIDDSSGPEGSTSSLRRKPSMKSFYGSSQNSETYPRECTSNASNTDIASRCGTATSRVENTSFLLEGGRSLDGNSKEPPKFMDHKSQNLQSNVVDSMESIDQDYVLVSEPSMDVSVSSASAPRQGHSQCKGMSPPLTSVYLNATSSVPMPIIGAATSNPGYIGSLESQSSAPGTLQETTDSLEHPSTDCLTRIKSLQLCAATITELVNEKIEAGQHLEAFSIQLVILAIWKQALHICHTQAASAMEGSPTQETMKLRRNTSSRHGSLGLQVHRDASNTEESGDILLQIEREFLLEVEHAEELVKVVEPGSTEMPDAMETIFQSALALGRNGAVDELMGDLERAAELYSKAVRLLAFLLVEAPSLILNPPFTLTTSDRYRLQTYIDILSGRLGHSRSQRLALVKE